MRTKQAKLCELLSSIYRKGIKFGQFNCNKHTGHFEIENSIWGKVNGFYELAGKILKKYEND